MRTHPLITAIWSFLLALSVLVGIGGGLYGFWIGLQPNLSIDVASSYDPTQIDAQRFTLTNIGNTDLLDVHFTCLITSWRHGLIIDKPLPGFLYATASIADPVTPRLVSNGGEATLQCELPMLVSPEETAINIQLVVFYTWPFNLWSRLNGLWPNRTNSQWVRTQKFSGDRNQQNQVVWTAGSTDSGWEDQGAHKNIIMFLGDDPFQP